MDLLPYWNDDITAVSAGLCLPVAVDSAAVAGNASRSSRIETDAVSWFSINRMPAPNGAGPRLFPPSSPFEDIVDMVAAAAEGMGTWAE